MKHQPVKQGQTTTMGISSPTLSDKCVGSLSSPANHITLKMQETGPTITPKEHTLNKQKAIENYSTRKT